jgi:hypothetical protein
MVSLKVLLHLSLLENIYSRQLPVDEIKTQFPVTEPKCQLLLTSEPSNEHEPEPFQSSSYAHNPPP